MKPSKLWTCLFVLVLIASACGGDDDSGGTTNPDSDQTSGDSTSDDGGSDDGDSGEEDENGEGAASASGTDFPEGTDEDFPVPVPAGWEIDIFEELAEQGATMSGGVSVLYSNDDFDRIIAFYDQWTGEDTVDYVRSEAGDAIIYSRMESPIYTINVTGNHEERDQTFTSLLITIPQG